MKDIVNIGIVGAGFSANFHADCYSRNPSANLVAIASPNPDGAALAEKWGIPKVYPDYPELLADDSIDLVSVCVPNFLHSPVMIAAAEAGKHVICEKPLATTIDEGRLAVEACRANNVKLMYGEDWCFIPSLVRAVEIIEEGGIGKVLYIKAKEVHSGSHSAINKSRKLSGGGALMNLGVHPVGFALRLLGRGTNPVVEVTGQTTAGGRENLVHHDVEGEDFAVGILRFANGEYALIEANYITIGGMDDVVEIYGTEGVLKIDLTFGSPIRCYSENGIKYSVEKASHNKGWSFPQFDEHYGLGYVDELKYFVDCVRDNVEPYYGVNGESALACLEIVAALSASSESGKTVTGAWK